MTDSVLGTDAGGDKTADGAGSRDTNAQPGVVAGQTGADGANKDTPPGDGGNKTSEGDKSKEGADANKDKSKDGPKGAPEKYEDFKMPDGVEVDKALLETATPLFKDANLPQEVAQKFVDFFAQYKANAVEAQAKQWNETRDGWVTKAKADKEIGGDNWDGKVSDAKLALDKFGTPDLRAALNDYGMGDHPEVIRVFSRIGALVKDDKLHLGGAPGAQKSIAERLYDHPTSQPKS
jgi:hypothetical protein